MKALYSLENETDYDPDPDSEDKYDESDSDSEFVDSNFSYIVVNTMPHHLLLNSVAFKQFLRRNNFRLSFDLSGPFSRKLILAMQAAHVRQTLASCEKVHQVVQEPRTAVVDIRNLRTWQCGDQWELFGFNLPTVGTVHTITRDNNNTSRKSATITKENMSSQSKKTAIPGNQLTCLDLWTQLPFHDELTVDDGIAGNKYMAEFAIPENELTLPDLWAELPFQTHLTVEPSSIAANKPTHANARSGAGDIILRAVDNLLAESGKAVEHGKCYRNATGEKEVENGERGTTSGRQ